jgi:arylsulfatase A-like enzyme
LKFLFSILILFVVVNCSPRVSNSGVWGKDSLTLQSETHWGTNLEKGEHSNLFKEKGRYYLSLGNPDEQVTLNVRIDGESWLIGPKSFDSRIFEVTPETVLTLDHPGFWTSPCFTGKKKKAKNVLLISIDTLRADHFNAVNMPKCYGFFSKGAIFNKVITPAPWTLPAHASLFTSLYPAHHGVRKPEDRLSPEIPTLAGRFSRAGYFTLAVTEGNYLAPMYGLHSGFQTYISVPPKLSSSNLAEASVFGKNIVTLNKYLDSDLIRNHFPAFVFLHSYEVHCPFLPRGDCKSPAEKGTTNWLIEHELSGFTEQDIADLKSLYASEVTYLDGVLFEFLNTLNPDDWVIALVSDHGEEFGEHGGLLHADTLFEEVLRIPMAIKGPNITPIQVSDPAILLDVAPTLASLAGLEPEPSWQGISWFSHEGGLQNTDHPDRTFLSESFFFGPHIPSENPRILGITHGSDKLIQLRNFEKFQAWFFDLESDPSELHNLMKTREDDVRYYYPIMEAYIQNNAQSLKAGEVTEEQAEVLRSLGYTH